MVWNDSSHRRAGILDLRFKQLTMKKLSYFILTFSFLAFSFNFSYAGNEDRVGEAGAYELLINPWARSSGWGNVNTGCVHGLEAVFGNIAGTAFTKQTEVIFAHTIYLKGSGINVNSFGLVQKAGKTGVFGLAVVAMDFGDIPITTTLNPDGGIGTFAPKFMNINLSYSKAFSNSIYGGINMKIISEAISDVSAQGFALDAGIQYVTGEKENIKFGISMKNVGTPMKFKGDGLSVTTVLPTSSASSSVSQKSKEFELPSLINIGAAYDFLISQTHTLTAAANFTSNSFSKDQYIVGLEYSFKGYLFLRGGFVFEQGIFNDYDGGDPLKTRTTPYTGPSGGFSIDIPLNKEKGVKFSLDYSYRATNPFQGTHSIGAKISL